MKVLESLEIGPDDHFCDLGSGAGLPNFIVAIKYGLVGTQNVGIEYERNLVDLANSLKEDLDITFIHKDISNLTSRQIARFTKIYTFDRVFLPSTFSHLKAIIERSRKIQIVASAHRCRNNSNSWSPMVWQQIASIPVFLAVSGERHTIYILKKKTRASNPSLQ